MSQARKITVSILFLCAAMRAQTAPGAAPLTTPHQTFLGSTGKPLSGGKACFFQAGTSNPDVTYTDSSGLTPNPTCVVFDSSGSANIWVASRLYKMIVSDVRGVLQWSADNVGNNGLIAESTLYGAGIDASHVSYSGGSVTVTVDKLLIGDHLDIREYGASTTSADNVAAIQLAISAAQISGPHVVLVPTGSWNIASHVYVPSGVYLVGSGQNVGGGGGSRLVETAAFSTFTFPFSAGLWQTGQNSIPSDPTAFGPNYGSMIKDLTIECGNRGDGLFADGRQENTGTDSLIVSNAHTIGLYDQGVDCQNSLGTRGCLIVQNIWGSAHDFDHNLFAYTSSSAPSTAIPVWLQGVVDYKGLDGTANCDGTGATNAVYVSGDVIKIGPIHIEQCAGGHGGALYAGAPPTINGLATVNPMPLTYAEVSTDVPIILGRVGGPAGLELHTAQYGGAAVTSPSGKIFTDASLFYNSDSSYFSLSDGLYINSPVHTVEVDAVGSNALLAVYPNDSAKYSGVNIQSAFDSGALYMRGLIGQDIHWDSATHLWKITGNGPTGGSDYGAFVLINGGSGCFSSDHGLNSGQSITTSNLLQNNLHWCMTNAGSEILGVSIDGTSGIIDNDTGERLQVNGTARFNGPIKVGTASGYTGTCGASTTLTVVNGIVTGCS